jgi:hypothetical protein
MKLLPNRLIKENLTSVSKGMCTIPISVSEHVIDMKRRFENVRFIFTNVINAAMLMLDTRMQTAIW